MTTAFGFREVRRTLLDALFPLECLACGAEGAYACDACLLGARPVPAEPIEPRPLVSAVGAYTYASPLVRTLIGDYKYRGYLAAAPAIRTLTRRAAAFCAGRFVAPEALIAVPLHARRFRSRGFNQAETIAEELASAWGVPLLGRALVRIRETRPQAEPETDRRHNVQGAFRADSTRVRGLRVVLVDDVWTTGASMRACAEALLQAGAAEVRGFSLAWGKGKPENGRHPPDYFL